MKCALHPKIVEKFTKTLFGGGSRWFKVIHVNKSKKPSPVLVMINSMFITTNLSASVFTLYEPITAK